nr:immunoglobulin light chain junction region [Macaca mulatta]
CQQNSVWPQYSF